MSRGLTQAFQYLTWVFPKKKWNTKYNKNFLPWRLELVGAQGDIFNIIIKFLGVRLLFSFALELRGHYNTNSAYCPPKVSNRYEYVLRAWLQCRTHLLPYERSWIFRNLCSTVTANLQNKLNKLSKGKREWTVWMLYGFSYRNAYE